MNSWRRHASTTRLSNQSPLPPGGEVAVSAAGEGVGTKVKRHASCSGRSANPLPTLRGRPLPKREVKNLTKRRWSTTTLLLFIVSTFTLNSVTAAQPEQPCKPFVAYSWRPNPDGHSNIIPFYWMMNGRDLADPSTAVAAVNAMPEGHRVIFSWDAHRDLPWHPEDACRTADGKLTKTPGVWWDNGVDRVAERFDKYFREFKVQGGHVDALILDHEVGLKNWSLGKKGRAEAIMADPRFDQVAKQAGISDLKSVLNWRASTDFRKWNARMAERTSDYNSQAVFVPVRKHFPKLKMSNWECFYNSSEWRCPDVNGQQHSEFGPGKHVGTHQSLNLYGGIQSLKFNTFVDGEFRTRRIGPRYEQTAFNGFRLAVNRMRTSVLSSDVPVWPWISYKRFGGSLVRDSDLYQEIILHAGLCGADAFLLWNPDAWKKDQKPEDYNSPEQNELVSRCLLELDSLVGARSNGDKTRQTLVKQLAEWYGDYVLTGMQIGDKNVWRLTPRIKLEAPVKSVIVESNPPRFRIGTSEIAFPSGTIHASAEPVSDRGIWIVTAAGVKLQIRKL
jgi:hypothetical protein